MSKEEAPVPVIVESVGFIINETKEYIQLARSYDADEVNTGYGGAGCIIKSCILERKDF
jgi:hypothetical protein